MNQEFWLSGDFPLAAFPLAGIMFLGFIALAAIIPPNNKDNKYTEEFIEKYNKLYEQNK
jgi:hypothetical protein